MYKEERKRERKRERERETWRERGRGRGRGRGGMVGLISIAAVFSGETLKVTGSPERWLERRVC